MKKIDGEKYPKPTIRPEQRLCCLINPQHVCKLCRAHLCKVCGAESDGKIKDDRARGLLSPSFVKTVMRQSDHLDDRCVSEQYNNEYESTWDIRGML